MIQQGKIQFQVPAILRQKIDGNFPVDSLKNRNIKNRAIKIIHMAVYHTRKDPHGWWEVGSRYFRKLFNGEYKQILAKLVEIGIFEYMSSDFSKETYTTQKVFENNVLVKTRENGVCKKIRFCQNIDFSSLFTEDIENLIIKKELNIDEEMYLSPDSVQTLEYTNLTKVLTKEQREVEKEFLDMVNSLKIDQDKIKMDIYSYVNSIDKTKFKLNDEITATNFEVSLLHTNSQKKKWTSKKKALSLANYRYETLIQDGNKFYIACLDYFIEWKKQKTMAAYMDSLYRVATKQLNHNRNKANNRLDTNFTNMPNLLFRTICEDNKLVQIDLSNSQFAILSHILKGKVNCPEFRYHAERGTLYDDVAERRNIPRKQAKIGFFETLFSSDKYTSPEKKELESLYPEVMKWISDYKKEYGDKKFVNMLQKKESEIFIDNILSRILEKTDFCLTKHDSVIVRKKDEKLAREVINQYFSEIDFKGNIE